MKVTIEIDEDELQKAIIDMVAKECARAYLSVMNIKGSKKRSRRLFIVRKRSCCRAAWIKASAELTRKALPKLLEKLTE